MKTLVITTVLACVAAPSLGISAALAADATTAPAADNTSGKGDLPLFAPGTKWTFSKNTGDGSFELKAEGGKAMGLLTFDFNKSKTKSVPYVLISTQVNIPEPAGTVQFSARAKMPQRVTVRLVDSTGQTLQAKLSAKGTGEWETLRISLNRKMEHWDGANDGKIHFPVKSLVISIPLTGENKAGEIAFADASVAP